ncbi:hypothetical protein F511_31851 [Dorcoceras hygrometricum]|uniref:DUF4378 domain-containing protein n=1 Tax=Dorcoceras hygrometricum TaxID=472368 RepID=A0A2Z7AJX4_9LAMI|nr:hypothetical protein F511_31851 [Dorcoceras hygrometricum]
MEVEKRGIKGGFFQLLDWNSKSRKKLFSSKPEVPDAGCSYPINENFRGSGIARPHPVLYLNMHLCLNANLYLTRVHSDDHYASSVSCDLEHGKKAPGVVARLMGLDSFPSTNFSDPCCTPNVESRTFRDSSYLRAVPTISQSEHDIVVFESVRNKLDGLIQNPLDLRMQKVHSRPVERFQSEVMPPKSAKPISITHHRLLSPIKSPGFIPPKNAAYIIEAATKIIEQSPRPGIKDKPPSLVSSSAPIRIRDLKIKMDAAQRSYMSSELSHKNKEQNFVKNKKKKLSAEVLGRSKESFLYEGSEESKRVGSQRLRSKEKSVSITVQAKANIQIRDRLTPVCNKSPEKQEEVRNTKPRILSGNTPIRQQKAEKKSSSRRPSEVLKPNHQKQNFVFVKGREDFEPSSQDLKNRKESNTSADYIDGRRVVKTVNKIVVNGVVTSTKPNSVVADPVKPISSSKAKSSKTKRLIQGNTQFDGSVPPKPSALKDEKSGKCNISSESNSKWETMDKRSLDIVSFTFTSPIKKSGSGSNLCDPTSEVTWSVPAGSLEHKSDLRNCDASNSGFNGISGDALSVLLEQKLEELTSRVELSQQNQSDISSPVNVGPPVNLVNSLPTDEDVFRGEQETKNPSGFSVNKNKGLLGMDKEGGYRKTQSQIHVNLLMSGSFASPPSFSGSSCYSFDVGRNLIKEGKLQCSSRESYEGTSWSLTGKSHLSECDVEMSDTASSLSVGTLCETVASISYATELKDTPFWELHYIRAILDSPDSMLEDFGLEQAHTMIPPTVFYQLEDQLTGSNKPTEDHSVLERKLLFDRLNEYLETNSKIVLAGSCKTWAKHTALVCRKQWLAEELFKEISRWRTADEVMVDELVDKDMSSNNGKWIDFEIEACEEGKEMEERILSSLVDELIDDFLS